MTKEAMESIKRMALKAGFEPPTEIKCINTDPQTGVKSSGRVNLYTGCTVLENGQSWHCSELED